jgi:hypothetical protein
MSRRYSPGHGKLQHHTWAVAVVGAWTRYGWPDGTCQSRLRRDDFGRPLAWRGDSQEVVVAEV